MWAIPSERMKRKKADKASGAPHIVPLSAQAVAILCDLQPLTGHGRYVFPSLRTGGAPDVRCGGLGRAAPHGLPEG